MSIEQTLAERGGRYGDFADHARIAQKLQDEMRGFQCLHRRDVHGELAYPWDALSVVQKQALTVIADKIARILSGDPNYADNWHDIQGYARLAEERLSVGPEVANDNLAQPICQLMRFDELPRQALEMIRTHAEAALLRKRADEMTGVAEDG